MCILRLIRWINSFLHKEKNVTTISRISDIEPELAPEPESEPKPAIIFKSEMDTKIEPYQEDSPSLFNHKKPRKKITQQYQHTILKVNREHTKKIKKIQVYPKFNSVKEFSENTPMTALSMLEILNRRTK